MKHKKSRFTIESEPKLTPAKQLAKASGLDPQILEKEAEQFGFGTVRTGVMWVDEAKYDTWLSTQIRQNGMERAKRVSHKSIAESDNIGILHAIPAKLTKQLLKDEPELQFQQQEIAKMSKGIQKKQALKKMFELSDKVANKKKKIKAANRRLEHLLDASLGLLDPPKDIEEVREDLNVDETIGATAHILEED